MNGALDFFITNCQMRLQADIVAQFTIAGHLVTALLARPPFCGLDKAAPERLQAQIGIDIPPFDVTDIVRVTTFGVVTYAHFEKTADLAVITFGNKNRYFPLILMKVVADLKLVIVFSVRPQGAAHA